MKSIKMSLEEFQAYKRIKSHEDTRCFQWFPKSKKPENGRPIVIRGDNTWGDYEARGIMKIQKFHMKGKDGQYYSDHFTWTSEVNEWRYDV